MTLAEFILGILAVIVLMPAGLLMIQVTAACLPSRPSPQNAGRRPGIAVLIPAHNEASGIAKTLESIQPQLLSGDRVLVVADNCSDDTASIARSCGAEVVERVDAAHHGKGYALEFGIRHLAVNAQAVVVIVDADCVLAEGALDRLARQAHALDRPIQGLYLMRSPESAGERTRVAEFAWMVKNWIRPLGYQRLGLPCQLMGSGMAFPWRIISILPLAHESIVEDIALGLEAARMGTPAAFLPQAIITSWFPVGSSGGQAEQRTRWEHGHLAAIIHDVPRLLWEATMRRNGKLFALLIDLCVPPLALLCIVSTAVLGASLALYAFTNIAWPAIVAGLALVMIAAAIAFAWSRFGRDVVSLLDLFYGALYAIAKIPLYARFLVKRESQWVRSRRDGH